MNGRALVMVLTGITLATGLATGVVLGTWRVDDRIDARMDRLHKPIEDRLTELKHDIAEVRGLVYQLLGRKQVP